MSTRKKKVIIITTIITTLALGICFFKDLQPKQEVDNSDQQYIATDDISLPNGGTIHVATLQKVHGRIGANLSELTQDIKQNLRYADQIGVYVQDTYRDSPALTAGILPGDIITQINHKDTEEVFSTIKLIASLQPGYSYPFTIFRQGQYLNYSVTISDQHFF